MPTTIPYRYVEGTNSHQAQTAITEFDFLDGNVLATTLGPEPYFTLNTQTDTGNGSLVVHFRTVVSVPT